MPLVQIIHRVVVRSRRPTNDQYARTQVNAFILETPQLAIEFYYFFRVRLFPRVEKNEL